MKKEKFIVSTFILLIGGFLTKALGMVIKMVMSRIMGSEGIGLYMLVLPTFSLFIGLGQFGLPIAFSKLVAEEKKNNRNLFFSLFLVSLVINLIIIGIILIFGKTLAVNLLHEKRATMPILAMSVVIPLTSCSGIVRSYFFGKQQMLPHVVSNCFEDIVRLALIVFVLPSFLNKGLEVAVTIVILTNIISELSSILILFFFLPKNLQLHRSDFTFRKDYAKEAMYISIPTTASRFIGSIGYFLEPIILTSTLTYCGYPSYYIVNQYGVLSGFVMPLLLLPSFFTSAISQALLPVLSKATSDGNYTYAKKKVKQGIFFSLFIGIPMTILFLLIPQFFLKLIYHTNQGTSYMRFLAPICLFQYIQSPLATTLDAMGNSNDNLKATVYGTILRSTLLFFFSLLSIGLWGLIFSTSINVIFTTFYNLHQVKKAFRQREATSFAKS
ncbi:MAG TPA: oligosaccharide flippase family protein [Candidatus Onthousia faecigallinarum]|nr:oligosaccharide flippase family protein [Candidatus Onthousia faecigallinarum]